MSSIAARAASRPRLPVTLWLIAGLLAAALASIAILFRAAPTTSGPIAPTSAQTVIDQVERRAVADDGSMDIQAILGTPAYFRMTGQVALAQRHEESGDIVLILSQDIHYGELPAVPRPPMVIDGRSVAPVTADTVFDSDHHRTVVLTYSDPAGPLAVPGVSTLELSLAGADGDLRWQHPFGGAGGAAAGGLSIPLLLALMGGMLASMWPCLFQLTAYFLPSVAGLSFDQAREGRADGAVLRTAVLFVSGIVIVYTLAGLAAGFAAQSVSGTAAFQAARQPLTFVAGAVIIGMAARLALRARRPLVCHMPTTSPKPRHGLGTVALGLAFATGCMTCFGAAVVLGMFTYVVTSASPLVGAAILFVFSLGIAVPLVIAAMAMARVLPLLTRLERVTPALTLLSAGIMGAYGVLLLTGTSHVMSDTIARVMSTLR